MDRTLASSFATVLVVDDDPGTVTTFAYALRASGRRVVTAATGTDAMRLVGETMPSLIVCDLNLPDLSGFDVLRALRHSGVDAPFILITGFASTPSAFQAGQLGVTEYLEKPIDTAALVNVVDQRLCDRRPKTVPLGYDTQLSRITQVVARHYPESNFDLATVARFTGVSKQHVCRVIRHQHAMTFADFVRKKRLHEACRYLRESRLSVKEIAFRVGFRRGNQLARAFRAVLKVSPSDYRQRHAGAVLAPTLGDGSLM